MENVKALMRKYNKEVAIFIHIEKGTIVFKEFQDIDDNTECKYSAFMSGKRLVCSDEQISESFGWIVAENAIIDIETREIYRGKEVVVAFHNAYDYLNNVIYQGYDEWTVNDTWREVYDQFVTFLKNKGLRKI